MAVYVYFIVSLFLFLQEFTRIKWSKNRDERWERYFWKSEEKDLFLSFSIRVDGVINSGGWQVGLIDLTVLIILVDLAS